MTNIKHLLLCIFIGILANSCQKVLEPQNDLVSAGILVKDSSGNCIPVNINGIYKINTALNSTNYMDVSVNVSAAGDYEIFTDALNGIHFGDTAQFTTIGVQVVRLKGYGTPVSAGVFSFIVHYGSSSSCAVPVTVSATTAPPAAFTLIGTPGNCTAPVIQGTYIANTPLNASNKLVVGVNVTGIGDYTLSTTVVNGISFSATGTFTVTGNNQTVTLSGSGTPLAAGTNPMMVTGSATGCSFPLTVDPVITTPDPAKFILLATQEVNPGPELSTTLTCYNFDKSIKWQRDHLGNTGYRRNNPGNPLYANGIVFFCEDSIFSIASNYYTMNNFYAIDINTGNNIWTKRSQTEYMQYPVVDNGIVYCNFQEGTTQSIAAFNAANGAFMWKTPIAEVNGADNLTVDGNTLYFFSVKTPFEIYINAFDLVTKTIKWKLPMGSNYFREFTAMSITGPILYLQNAAGKIMALDKTTGSTVWATTNTGYGPPQIVNNLAYALDAAHNVNAFNAANGTLSQSWTTNLAGGTRPYIDGRNIYLFGIDAPGNYFVSSYNIATGGLNWRQNNTEMYENPVVTGNTIYAMDYRIGSPSFTKIGMFDASSGAYQGAIPISPTVIVVGEIRIITASGKFIHPY